MNKKYENSKAEKYLSIFPKTIQFITLFMILYNFYHKIVNHCQRLNLKEIIFVKIMISLQFLAQSLLEISYSNLPHLRIASWDSSSEEKSKLDPGVRKKAPFQGVKMAKKGCHSLFRPVHMYKKYILKKNWVKTAIPALSSGRNNLPPPIWCCHRQLDDQHRNPNMNNKDHLVGN